MPALKTFTPVPDSDSSLDSIVPYTISEKAPSQVKSPTNKPQKAKAPAKPSKIAPRKTTRASQKGQKTTGPSPAPIVKEKEGFLITMTRSGRQSHRPLKQWANEKGPTPEITIKYNFMKVGVSISKHQASATSNSPAKEGVTEKICPVSASRGESVETNRHPSSPAEKVPAVPKTRAPAKSKRPREESAQESSKASAKKPALSKVRRNRPLLNSRSLGGMREGFLWRSLRLG